MNWDDYDEVLAAIEGRTPLYGKNLMNDLCDTIKHPNIGAARPTTICPQKDAERIEKRNKWKRAYQKRYMAEYRKRQKEQLKANPALADKKRSQMRTYQAARRRLLKRPAIAL